MNANKEAIAMHGVSPLKVLKRPMVGGFGDAGFELMAFVSGNDG